ncbi:hypothetical protein J4061_004461, partial [Salmonella enterica]|nr:hypothetical protein [Salmonella enterica]
MESQLLEDFEVIVYRDEFHTIYKDGSMTHHQNDDYYEIVCPQYEKNVVEQKSPSVAFNSTTFF